MSIKSNTLWNLFGSAAPMIVGIAAVPYIYHKISTERLGVLTIVWALIGYSSIFDFGLGRAITQRIAASITDQHGNISVNATATTGVLLTLVIGIAGAGVGLIAIRLLGVGWMNANKGLEKEITLSFILACIAVPATTITTGMRGILEGLQQFSQINVLKFTLGASNFLGPVLAIHFFGPNLASIVATLVIARLATLLAYYYAVHSFLDIITSGVSIEEAKKLFRFGGWMTLSNLISPLMVVADRFFISHAMGARVVAYYTVPAEFLIRLLIIPAAFTATCFPVFSKALSTKDDSALIIYRRATQIIFGAMSLTTVLICLGSKWGLTLWLGPVFARQSYGVTSILAIGILFNSLAQIPLAFIQASGDARATALIHLLESFVYIPILLVMLKAYGITGAATAWTIRALLDLLLLHAQAERVKEALIKSSSRILFA
jgi:O-antigen/teichoic acid export membrane protein